MKPLFSFKRSRSLRELKQLAKENAAEGKPLCVMDDVVFKIMFSSDTEDSREALRCLLSACIGREIAGVRVLNSELLPAHLAAKTVRLDVNVTFNDGEAADLEMQIGKSDDDLKTRAAYYAAMLWASQSKKGDHYKDIKRVYQIFFLNCILFPGSDKLPRRYSYREETEQDQLTKAVEIIFYEMPKLEQRVKDYLAGKVAMEPLPKDEKWCMYMKYRHEELAEPLIKELCRKEEGIMHAEKALSKIDRNYAKAIREMNIRKNEIDRYYAIRNAQREARAEGLAEGKAEANLEIARKFKAMGLPIEQIVEGTGISLDKLEKI